MKPETICCGCGRTIEKAFIYCPWCGHQRISAEKSMYRDTISNQYDYAYCSARNEYLENIGKRLDNLEKELDGLALAASPEFDFA